jgi:hypothetical protein
MLVQKLHLSNAIFAYLARACSVTPNMRPARLIHDLFSYVNPDTATLRSEWSHLRPNTAKTGKIDAKACLRSDFQQPRREFHMRTLQRASQALHFSAAC